MADFAHYLSYLLSQDQIYHETMNKIVMALGVSAVMLALWGCEKDEYVPPVLMSTDCVFNHLVLDQTIVEEDFSTLGTWTLKVYNDDASDERPYNELKDGNLVLYSGGLEDLAKATLILTDSGIEEEDKLMVELDIDQFRRPNFDEPATTFSIELGDTKLAIAPLSIEERCDDDCDYQTFDDAEVMIMIDKSANMFMACMSGENISDRFEMTTGSFGNGIIIESRPFEAKDGSGDLMPNMVSIDDIKISSFE